MNMHAANSRSYGEGCVIFIAPEITVWDFVLFSLDNFLKHAPLTWMVVVDFKILSGNSINIRKNIQEAVQLIIIVSFFKKKHTITGHRNKAVKSVG